LLPDGHGQAAASAEIARQDLPSSENQATGNVSLPAVPLAALLAGAREWLDHVSSSGAAGRRAGAPHWPAWVAAAILAIVGALVARLVGGLWSARRLLRSDCRITDAQLVRQVDRLRRALGCKRPVEVFTSPVIQSAATIGWRRPAVVLSASWRSWSDVELTAVLAHELTHVRRLDFLVGIVARVAAIVHFYNPLVRWMARSMAFAQEAVADQAAARAVGGRQTYLVVLSRLALRQDRQFHSLPVLAFAFTSSTFLMRRIQMLQTTDGRPSSSRVLHAVVFALLVVSAAAASTLRQQAHSQEGGQADVRIANKKNAALGAPSASRLPGEGAALRPSIDLSYLPEAKQGLVSMRPKALFAHAKMRPVTALIDAAIRQRLASLGVDEGAAFSVAEIEQVMGQVIVEVLDSNGGPGERGRLMMGLSAVRFEKRLPYEEVLEAAHLGATVTQHGGATIIETPEAAVPAFGPLRHFAMPDEHTVLPGISGEALTKLTKRPSSEQIAAKPWFELWQAVEQDTLAIVLDNSSGDWNAPWNDLEYAEAKTLAAHSQHVALGCDLRDDKLDVQVIVECTDAADSHVVIDSLKGVLRRSIREAEKQSPAQVHSIRVRDENPADESPDADYLRRLYVSVLQTLAHSEPAVDAGRISLRASVDVDVSIFTALAGVFAGEFGASAENADASAK
jgi:beta-lactamase regulating signal transducer with metallopeptidase domain